MDNAGGPSRSDQLDLMLTYEQQAHARTRAAFATAEAERDAAIAEREAANEALAACQSQGYSAIANLYALCRRMNRQKTDAQRDEAMAHATRIANQAGIPTGVTAMLRDAVPTDAPTLVKERDAAIAERDAALDMVAEVGQPLAALSMPQIHRNADVVKALRQREIAAKETVKRLGDGIMRCIDASWSSTRSLDWTHPELILAEYVDALRAEQTRREDATVAAGAAAYAEIMGLGAALTEARRVLAARDECIVCKASLHPAHVAIPHCVDCVVEPEHEEEWDAIRDSEAAVLAQEEQ